MGVNAYFAKGTGKD